MSWFIHMLGEHLRSESEYDLQYVSVYSTIMRDPDRSIQTVTGTIRATGHILMSLGVLIVHCPRYC